MGMICSCCSTTDVHNHTKMSKSYKGSKVGMKRNWTREPEYVVTKKARVVPAKKSLESLVRSAMIKASETKSDQFTVDSAVVPYNNTGWASVGLRPITPSTSGIDITSGAQQGDRIGNRLTTKKVTLDMIFWPAPYNVTTNPTPVPLEVIIWIIGLKESNVLPTNLDDFFQNGNTTTDPNGTGVDVVKTYNKDKWVVHKRVVRKLGYAAYTGSGPNAQAQYHSNNDFNLNQKVRLDLTKYCPKSVVWDDTGNPTSRGVYIAIEAVPADGGQLNASYTPARMYYNLNYQWCDL